MVLAVAVGLYAVTNYQGLLQLKIPIPLSFQPLPLSPRSGLAPLSTESASYFSPVSEKTSEKTARILSVRTPSSFSSYAEVVVWSNTSGNETVNVTGWTVKSNKGSFAIPQAQEEYSFGGSPSDIRLGSGNRVAIYSLEAIKGNFRLNKCLGYIEDVSPFLPALPRTCLYISRSEVNHLSGACQDYVLSLRTCQQPAANPPVPVDDSNCHDFLRKLNYVGCVEKYRRDADFLSSEWRVWLGNQANIFDPLHDKIQLIDKTGKVVDEYTY